MVVAGLSIKSGNVVSLSGLVKKAVQKLEEFLSGLMKEVVEGMLSGLMKEVVEGMLSGLMKEAD